MNETRIAAFVEYVLRPLAEDWRLILEQVKSLNIGVTQETIQRLTFYVGTWHIIGEAIRAASYIIITSIICYTLYRLWPLL